MNNFKVKNEKIPKTRTKFTPNNFSILNFNNQNI